MTLISRDLKGVQYSRAMFSLGVKKLHGAQPLSLLGLRLSAVLELVWYSPITGQFTGAGARINDMG